METMALERSILINAPRERIWQAITDPAQIVKWLVPAVPGGELQRDDNGKLMMVMGPISVDFTLMRIVDEQRQVIVHSLPDHQIATTYTLESENGGTCVTVKMSGFESLIEQSQQERLNLSGASWEKTLQNLKAYVDGADLPFPFAAVSPLFGYWRESKKALAAERSIWIDAKPERVWYAITDPKEMQLWYSPTTEWRVSAFEVGGRIYAPNPETNAEMYVEIIELLNPPHQLVTRTVPEAPDMVVKGKTYTLKEEKGGTRLTITLAGYEQEPEDIRWAKMDENTFGFGMVLQNAKAYIEGKELPFPWGF